MKELYKKYMNDTSDSDDELKCNMPNLVGSMFYTLFKSDKWSWFGLAKILVDYYTKSDMEDFIYLINEELKKK